MSLGIYPELGLRDARAMRDEARTLIAKGINLKIAGKQKQRAAQLTGEHTFIAVYERWLAYRALALEEGRQSTLRLMDRMSENTVNFALKRMGLRATMSTALNEIGYPKAWVDAQLSHADPNRIRGHLQPCAICRTATRDDAGLGEPAGFSGIGCRRDCKPAFDRAPTETAGDPLITRASSIRGGSTYALLRDSLRSGSHFSLQGSRGDPVP